ncbi:MAG TPA: hypothetical protein VHA73_07915 [Acidimicrobiales bacterium]|nr:hypothetical protein [Acidimicrobiales bacterium]
MAEAHRIRPPFAIDLRATLVGLQRGADDPTLHLARDGSAWRASRTPDGPATLHLVPDGLDFTARAWGPGAEWAIAQAPALIGCHDTTGPDFDDGDDPVISRLRRRLPGLRFGRTDHIFEALLPAILEHQVTTFEAGRAYRQVVRDFGEPAPGPADLVVPPDPDRLATVPYYDLHIRGVEQDHADHLLRICAHARRLPALLALSSADAQTRLRDLPGVTRSTAAEVAAVAMGDPDAVPLDDHSLPSLVSWFLTGDTDADEHRMLELLEPWRGQRARVIRLFQASGMRPPRHAPHRAPRTASTAISSSSPR